MANWKVRKATKIISEITVPGDKSISHRAVLLAALSNGTCVIRGFLASGDCLATVEAMRTLGVEIEQPEPTTLVIHGRRGVFDAPKKPIDCGNSGTLMRLLAGLLAAQPFKSELVGDESLSGRPMKRIADPLQLMGAKITGHGPKLCPPLTIEGGNLKPIRYEMPVASAQVKSAILLAGLRTKGRTLVVEPAPSRNHTEVMMEYYLVRPVVEDLTISLTGPLIPESRDFMVPGDVSSAAFWMVAAAAQPESHLIISGVGLNDTRTGVLAVLIRMGAHVNEIVERVPEEDGEARGTVEIRGVRLRSTVIGGREIPNVIDELPILAVAAALASGTTVITDAAELRVKETDRLAAIATNLRAMGVSVDESEDGLEIHGGTPLKGAKLSSFGDHRIAMAFAIAGLFAEGETVIEDVECVQTSYPSFHDTLEQIVRRPDKPGTQVITSLSPETHRRSAGS